MRSALVLALLLVFNTQSIAADPSAEHSAYVQQFEYAGIDFSTNRDEFVSEYPDAFKEELRAIGYERYWLADPQRKAAWLHFEFFGRDLCSIAFVFKHDAIARYGGIATLNAGTVKRFGNSYRRVDPEMLAWSFAKVDRVVYAVSGDFGWALVVAKPSIIDTLSASKAKQDTGFKDVDSLP